jgi:hypothetical protein
MNILTQENIEYITDLIKKSSITSDELKEDLIDHFCCAIEEEMRKGSSFEKSFDTAYQNICPNGLEEIQMETVFLLTSKNVKTMRRLLYLSGYLSLIGLTSTVFMKTAHIPFAPLVLYLTAIIIVFLFLPSLFLNLYKRDLAGSFSEKVKYVSGFLGAALLVAYIVFRMSHWPGSAMIFLAAIIVINFAFFPFIFLKMYKKN